MGKAFIMRCITFSDFKKALFEAFSTGAAAILYNTGLICGERSSKRLKQRFKDASEAIDKLAEYKSREGWFKLDTNQFNREEGRGRIICRDLFEAKQYTSNQPSCYFTKGYLKAYLTHVYNREVEVKEVECLSKGDKNCVFEVS